MVGGNEENKSCEQATGDLTMIERMDMMHKLKVSDEKKSK